MNGEGKTMDEKVNTELERNNKVAMIAHAIDTAVMIIFCILQAVAGRQTGIYVLIISILGIAPIIAEYVFWKQNHETSMVKHFMAIGFAIFYTVALFTSTNNMVFVFVIPMILLITIYNDARYSLLINIGTVLESFIVVIVGANTGKFGYTGLDSAIIQVIVMILIGIYSFMSAQVLNINNKNKVEAIKKAQGKTELLLNNISELSQKMESGIEDIHVELDKLNEASSVTQDAMKEVTVGTNDTAEAVQKQLLQTEAIQNRVNMVNEAADNITESMHETLNVLERGNQDVKIMVQMVEKSVQNGADVAEKLQTLDKYMAEMNSIVELISGITSQTSLLSLNASIEAARAGEAGKGFAVVATEISGMATQTQDATEQITALINNVSGAISEVVEVIHQMIAGIDEEKQGAANTADSFSEIQNNTYAIRDSAKDLMNHIVELKEANNEIVDSIQTISAISEEVSAHASDTLESEEANTGILDKMKEKMQELLKEINH